MQMPSFKLLFERPKNDSNLSAKTIATYRKRILLLKNKDNSYELPGGHVKIGEPIIAGATREFFEETGIQLYKLKLIKKSKERALFYASLNTNIVKLSDEHVGYVFVKPSEVFVYPLSPKARNDLKIIKKEKKQKKDEMEF
tara:strand:+ start:1874 stop:2296 length:423 start_codon:yes stop_codon:yes gene_type:complete